MNEHYCIKHRKRVIHVKGCEDCLEEIGHDIPFDEVVRRIKALSKELSNAVDEIESKAKRKKAP